MKYFHQVKPDVVLLDDGFQHLQIHRSFNILLFDATMAFSRYQVAPLGYLREGMTALKDADAILISRADLVPQKTLDDLKALLKKYYHHHVPVALTTYHPVGVFDVHDKYIYSTHELKGKKAIAVTAIANPDSFYQNLNNFGIEIVEKVSFPDHYFFRPEDINDLLIKAAQNSAIILCSEKDIVKMKRVSLDSRLLFIKVKLEFISGEQELTAALSKVLHLDSGL